MRDRNKILDDMIHTISGLYPLMEGPNKDSIQKIVDTLTSDIIDLNDLTMGGYVPSYDKMEN